VADQTGVTTKRGAAIGIAAVLAMVLTVLSAALGAPAGAVEETGDYPDGPGSISIEQGPIGQTGFCLPSVFALSYSAQNTPTAFILTITASPSLCESVDGIAAIYAMPNGASSNFNAWPQTLATKTPFTIQGPGTTTITFTKGCLPAQFDTLAGGSETPPKIDPWGGPFHGPMLFPWPYNIDSAFQWFGGDCSGTGCESYTPTNLAIEPTSVAPGDKITVSGNGVAGTTIVISFRQPPGAPIPTGVTVVVPEDGKWSVEVTVPQDMEPGEWEVVAGVEDCDVATTADITVVPTPPVEPPVPPVEPPVTPQPPTDVAPAAAAVASATTTPLPAAAVAGTSTTNSAAAAGAGLAYTGSSVRVPVLIGIVLLVAGTLLVLQRRRRS